ncbi:MAG: DUF1214 domain-containing protein [Clostridiales bacterium]|nr:DUF1214 domain-containing protein [Clostridiales bacterium]
MKNENSKEFLDIYEAYVYAYPAVIFELTRRAYLNSSPNGKRIKKTNVLVHDVALADASFHNVVAPNIDTVYSQSWLDLSEGALILEKPELDRYVSIAFLDAYTNCENIIGTGTDGNHAARYLITGPDFAGDVPKEYQQIALPTNNAWGIVRTIIYGKDDMEAVRKIQEKLVFQPYGNARQEVIYPIYDPELDYKPIEKISDLSLEEFFKIFNEILEHNPDKYAPVDKLQQWRAYGIGAGETFTDEQAIRNLEHDIKQKFLKETNRSLGEGNQKNHWSYPDPSIGIYKTDYLLRANVARNGLGANPVTMCVYPSIYVDQEGNPLNGKERYQIHFEKGQLPPVNENGFWSITLYDSEERYLVENEIHRYGINDRDILRENEDGSIDILIQQEKPENEPIENWLPSGSESFNLILRIYLPRDEVITGQWEPPVLHKV